MVNFFQEGHIYSGYSLLQSQLPFFCTFLNYFLKFLFLKLRLFGHRVCSIKNCTSTSCNESDSIFGALISWFIELWMNTNPNTNCGIFGNSFFAKSCPRIHKNGLTHKLCTILEWDKCQQFADFIKFVVFGFLLTQ